MNLPSSSQFDGASPPPDPRVDHVIVVLREHVNRASSPRHKHAEIGRFVELLEVAAASVVGKGAKIRVSQWREHTTGVNGAVFKQVEAAYGLRNLGAHLNAEHNLLTSQTAAEDVDRLARLLPWVAHGFNNKHGSDFMAHVLLAAERTNWDPAPKRGGGWKIKIAATALALVTAGVASQWDSFASASGAVASRVTVSRASAEGAAAEERPTTAAQGAPAIGEAAAAGSPVLPAGAPGVGAAERAADAEQDSGVALSADAELDTAESPPDERAEPGDGAAADAALEPAAAAALAELRSYERAPPSRGLTDGQPGSHRWLCDRLRKVEDALDAQPQPNRQAGKVVALARLRLVERCCSVAPRRDCVGDPIKVCASLSQRATRAVGQLVEHGEQRDTSAASARLAVRLAQDLERPVRVAALAGRPGASSPRRPAVMPRAWLPAKAAVHTLAWAKSQRRGRRWGSGHWFTELPTALVLWRAAARQALVAASPHGGELLKEAHQAAWQAATTWMLVRYVQQEQTAVYLTAPGRAELLSPAPPLDDDLALLRELERLAPDQRAARQASALVAGLECVLEGRNCAVGGL